MKNKQVIIRLLIGILLLVLLVIRIGKENLIRLPDYFFSADWRWIGIGILLFLVALLLGTARWGILLEVQGIRLNFASLFSLTYMGFFFSNFLPGVVGGDLVKLYYLGKKSGKTGAVFSSLFMDRTLGLLGLLTIAFISLLMNLERLVVKNILPQILLWFTVLLFLLFLLLNRRSAFLFSFLTRIKKFRLGERFQRLLSSFQLYGKRKPPLLKAYLLSLFLQLEMIIIAFLVSLALRVPIPLIYFFFFFPLISLIMSLPISISGLGTREWAYVFFFTNLPGIKDVDALAISLGLYLVTLLTSLGGGILYIIRGGEVKECSVNT